jgi:hypothetical protein
MINVLIKHVCRVVAVAVLVTSCAAAPAPRSGPPPARVGDANLSKPPGPPPRIKDSAPERAASLRTADPNLQLEAEDQRWGIDQARERKRRTDENTADQKQREKNEKKIVPLSPGSGRVDDPAAGGSMPTKGE